MNPDTAEMEPHKELPKPAPNAGELLAPLDGNVPKQGAEIQSKRAELPGSPGGAATPAQHSQVSPPQSPPLAHPSQQIPIQVNDSPAVAEDADLIEKEWVIKAKAIVEKTRDDPHAQKKEISKFKADYMKKRYNKNLKVTEE